MNRLLALSILILMIPNVGAQQSPLPTVSIECGDGPHEIEVYPGSTMVTVVTCTVTNDSLHSETVEFAVSAGDLTVAAPGSVSLGPGDEIDIEISFRGDSTQSPGSRSVDVNATVTQANGLPCAVGCGEDSDSFDIQILQFASVSVASRTGTLNLDMDQSGEVTIDITNKGNAPDEFSIEIENMTALESMGFQFSVNDTDELEPGEQIPLAFTVSASSDVVATDIQVSILVTSKSDSMIFVSEGFNLRSDGAPEPLIGIGGDETALLYGGISVAGVLIVVLVIFIALRSVRRKRVVAFDDEFDDFVDFDDF